jgi:hypothetical protein
MTLAMSGATRGDSGLASGLVNTSLQVGGAVGLSILATVAATRTDTLRAAGDSEALALTGGYHLAFLIAAGLVLGAVALAATVLRPEPVAAQEVEAVEVIPEPAYSEAA